MTDPFPYPGDDATDPPGLGDPTALAGVDDLPSDGLLLGDLGTPGAGDTTFLGPGDDPSGPAAFYTHSGTPCG